MAENACIIGSRNLAELLARGMKEQGYGVFLGLPAGEEAPQSSWNPRSPISTGALITEAQRTLRRIDEALLIFDVPGLRQPFRELSARAIETSVDDFLKGPLFLLREMINTLLRQGSGCLHIILTSAPASEEHPMDAALRRALIGFTESFFALRRNDGLILHGFQAVDMEAREYSEAIVSAVIGRQKNYHGRWHRLGSSPGILSSLSFGGRKK